MTRFTADSNVEIDEATDETNQAAADVGFRRGELLMEAAPENPTHEACTVISTELPLQGAAQRANIACAWGVARELGATPQGSAAALRQFRSLPHRQELVAEQGIRFVNDSKATTPCAAACALEAYGEGQHRVVWLAGGSSKGTPFEELAQQAGPHIKAAIFYGKTASEMASALRASPAEPSEIPIFVARDLSEAFERGVAWAETGDVMLLSPACASYDQFRSYEERGERFRQLAQSWCKLVR